MGGEIEPVDTNREDYRPPGEARNAVQDLLLLRVDLSSQNRLISCCPKVARALLIGADLGAAVTFDGAEWS